MLYVSFISVPCCLAVPYARPPAPKLPQPLIDLIHVAPPMAFCCCCVRSQSAVPNWNVLPLRCRNLYGMVGVVVPFRNKGKSGTQPSIRSQGLTYRIRVWDSDCSYSLVVA